MRKSGLFAILLAAVVATGCGSAGYSSSTTADYAVSESSTRAAAGVSNRSAYTMDTEYDYDSGTEAVADVYDESDLAAMDPYYGVDDASTSTDGKSVQDDSEIAEVDTSKKIIRNMNYSVETTDLDSLDQAIQDKVAELGGYIESSQMDGGVTYDDGYYLDSDGNTYYDTSYAARSGKTRQYRYAYYTIRIPAENLDAFAAAVEDGANVTSHNTYTQDITSSYVDTDARRKSLEEEQQILNEMMRKAESIEDMIQIEDQLSDVRYQLENIRSQLKSMDDSVSYSTVNLDVTEVTVLTDTTARDLSWQERVTNGFTTSCERLIETSQEIAIWIASNAPMIVFYIVLAVIGLVILRIALMVIAAILGIKRNKKSSKAKESPKAGGTTTSAEAAADRGPVETGKDDTVQPDEATKAE